VTICLENMNSRYPDNVLGRPDQICDHVGWGFEVCKRVNSPSVKMLFDIYHAQVMDGNVCATIKDNLQWIAHFHTAGVPGRRVGIFTTDTELVVKSWDRALEAMTGIAADAAKGADLVLVAVKPPIVPALLKSVAEVLTSKHLVISIAAGVRVDKMEGIVGADVPVIRSMPNTPCLVGYGATALCRGTHATHDHLQLAQSLFAAVGESVEVEERLMDAVTGLSGSGPAYVYMMIEAMADGGVMAGLTRGTDPRKVLENACRLGAYVASHNGATPLLPVEITAPFRD